MSDIINLMEAANKVYTEKKDILTDEFLDKHSGYCSAEIEQEYELIKEKRETLVEELIKENLKYCPTASEQVLRFIADFLYHGVPEVDIKISAESIRSTFRAGYCYYFAHMLFEAFNRGTICWAAPYGHIVWVDINEVPYDIEGVNFSDCKYYIPCSYLGENIADFKHVAGVASNTSEEVLEEIIRKYEEDAGIIKK